MMEKFWIRSGFFDSVCLADSPRQAAIESIQFLKGGEVLDECLFVSPSGTRPLASNTYIFSTDKILNEYNHAKT